MTAARPLPFARRLRYGFETALVYAIYFFFRALPVTTASDLGGALIRRVGPWFAGPNRTARRNLALALPEKSKAEHDAIILGMWENLGRVMAEYAHLDRIWEHAELVGTEHLLEARESGEPCIFFSAHMANWEVTPIAARTHGMEMHLVYRKPNNPGVENLLRFARSHTATKVIPKGAEGARQLVAALRGGKAIGILMDQKLSEGIPVPFFGHPAMTATALASLTLTMKCRVYPARIERLQGCKLRITIYPVVEVPQNGEQGKDTLALLTRVNAEIESWVRERPEQWLWIHRRWGNLGAMPGLVD